MNLLLCTDTYKMGHMEQYPPGTTKIYSYLQARNGTHLPETVFYGLRYYLKHLQTHVPTHADVDEFLMYRKGLLGTDHSGEVEKKLRALVRLGHIPLRIRAVNEGSVVPVRNVLMTIESTHPEFAWVVGFFESFLLKVWNTCTVASFSRKLYQLCNKYAEETCSSKAHLPFQVHDFGYRGCSSEETAALSGSAHLLYFLGTDTVPALQLIREIYGIAPGQPIGLSVPATEHSVMCSFGRENELAAFEHQLSLYPSGIVSIVSDTYDLWNVLTNFTVVLKDRILKRQGRVVFRPDSGDPVKIICGDKEAPEGTPAFYGALALLETVFGATTNEKGYKELHPSIGLIYGDGFYYERFVEVFETMKARGWASSNLVVGMGGLLLQQHSRDVQGYAIKATYAEIDGKPRELFKDPITDPGKKSHMGKLNLHRDAEGNYTTVDHCNDIEKEWQKGELHLAFNDGRIYPEETFDVIRSRARAEKYSS